MQTIDQVISLETTQLTTLISRLETDEESKGMDEDVDTDQVPKVWLYLFFLHAWIPVL